MSGTRGKLVAYLSNRDLGNLSQAEVDRYVEQLTDAGQDEGPEWDRIYRWLEKKGYI